MSSIEQKIIYFMSEKLSLTDDPARLEEIAIKFRDKILDELSKLDVTCSSETLTSEQQLKSYTGYFKLLQNLEEMIKRVQQERDKKSDRGVDILEFRRQLEEQIAKLVTPKTEKIIP